MIKSVKGLIALLPCLLFANLAFSQEDPEEFYNLGKEHLENAKYIEAIGEFTHALSIDPSMGKAYLDRAKAKKGLAEQFGFNDTELCHDLVAALHQGLLEARELMEEKCMGHCFSQKKLHSWYQRMFFALISVQVLCMSFLVHLIL